MKRARAYELLNKKEECLRGDVYCKGVEQGAVTYVVQFQFQFQKAFENSKGGGDGGNKSKNI